jgi:hypothetical protein
MGFHHISKLGPNWGRIHQEITMREDEKVFEMGLNNMMDVIHP